MKACAPFTVAGEYQSPGKHFLGFKWFQAIRKAEEVQEL